MDKVFYGIMIFAVGFMVGLWILGFDKTPVTIQPALAEAVDKSVEMTDYKLTIHTAKGGMSYLPAPKSENVDSDLKLWFYPDDADIFAIVVTIPEGASWVK